MDKKPLKICHVASVDITVKFLLLGQLKFLKEQGYDVYAVCSKGEWKKDIELEGIKVKNIRITRKITPFSDLVSLAKLYFYFKKEKFDIVHTHTPKPSLLGQLAAKATGVPIIIDTVHGLYFENCSGWIKRNFFIFIRKIAAKRSDLIFSQNKEDIETMIKEKIAKPEKIRYLGNGIDIEKFNPEKFTDDFIKNKKKKLGLLSASKIVGVVGRLVEEKGYFDLFEAFKKVLGKFPNALLLVIGPEEPEKKDAFLPSVVKKYGIEDNVTFLGQRTDLNELYALMDVFVLPSYREGFPRTVIEAMAMKRPIIATDIRGCREAIENGRTGILVPVKSPEKLSESIIYLLSDTEDTFFLPANAIKKAKQDFNENSVFKSIEEEYKRLIGEKVTLAIRPRVCHVTTVDITLRFILLDFLRFLKQNNYPVFVLCSLGKWKPFLEDEGFSVHNIRMTRRITPLADFVSFLKLFFYFRKQKFDVVHTYTPKAGVLGRIAARLAGVPVVIHTSYGFYRGIKIMPVTRTLIMIGEKVASWFCDLVFSQNQEDIDWAVKNKIVSFKKIKLSSYGIDVERFNPEKFTDDFILQKKKELGLENKKVIGMVGRFVKEKGYLDLFDAFVLIKKKISDSALVLVAPADKEKHDALDKSVLKEYGIEKDVVLLGYEKEVADIEKIYSLMDVFVLPSYREGLSMSLLEAQAMEKPVVATDIRGCRESVSNGETGVLVSTKNSVELAEVVIEFISNNKKSEEFGRNGRKMVLEKFDERKFFGNIKEEYERVTKR